MWPETPKDSLILSVFTGCLPGIIYNIEKWRQIQCNYGVCLWDSAENNIPIKTCEDQKSYLECKFWFGEIFQLLPIWWLRGILEKITYILSDPLALIFALADYIICPISPAPLSGACKLVKGIAITAQIFVDIQALFDTNNWKVQGDMCEVYFDRLDELEGEGDEED
ncbi:MAG: hypothetical protein KKC75_06645 [Nanoarchaeota archaeon]|nr:hypothetical protein [Nanoarchaeota archaeon]